jgi:cytoskeletal protein CcmA (bactofilin family)
MFNRDGGKVEKPEPQQTGAVAASKFAGTTQNRPGSSSAARPEAPNGDVPTKSPAQLVTGSDKGASKLVVGADIKLRGLEITDCDTLYVEGRVEASLDTRIVQIAEKGVFSGTASMDVAEIWGRFDGELTARQQLIVHASGRVCGTVRYGSLRIEEGGEISGNVDVIKRSDSTESVQAPAVFKVTPYEPDAAEGKQQLAKPTVSSY